MEEFSLDTFRLLSLYIDKNIKESTSDSLISLYHASDADLPDNAYGIYIRIGDTNTYLAEWAKMKSRLSNDEISKVKYFEWKLQFPYSSPFYQNAHGI